MIIKQELATIHISDPALNWYDLHEIISECNGEDGYRGHVEHRVELTDLSDEGNILEVLVEEIVDLARVGGVTLVGIALIRQATKCKPCHKALREEENRCNDI